MTPHEAILGEIAYPPRDGEGLGQPPPHRLNSEYSDAVKPPHARTKKRGFHGSPSFLCRNQNNQQFLLQWNSSSIQYSRGMAFFMFSMRAFSFSESIAWRRI